MKGEMAAHLWAGQKEEIGAEMAVRSRHTSERR